MNLAEYNKSVDDFSDGLFRFLLKNCKDKEKSRDLVQDTFEKLWLNHKNVEFEKVKSYLFTVAYHTLVDLVRREKKFTDFSNVDAKNYSHNEQYSDMQQILHQAIDLLPADQKSVVLLRDYEGYSYEEIAEITGLSESQVKVYIFRARTFLKNYIGKVETLV